MSVKPHFDATLTINATLPSNSLRSTVASVPRRFAEKSYAPFMTTASTARREETDAWREPELSANPLADETKSVPAARSRSINLETAFLDLQFPGLCRFLCRTGSWFTPADEAWQGKKDRFGTNASQDAIAAQIRYLVYLRTRHIHVSMHMSPYTCWDIIITRICTIFPIFTSHAHAPCPHPRAPGKLRVARAMPTLPAVASKAPQRAKAAARWHRRREHARLRSLAGA